MQVGLKDLTVWSFLMASAHGAGLMVLPLVIGGIAMPHCLMHASQHRPVVGRVGDRSAQRRLSRRQRAGRVVVFEKLGVGLLRKAWFNLDLVWAISLVVTSLATVMMESQNVRM